MSSDQFLAELRAELMAAAQRAGQASTADPRDAVTDPDGTVVSLTPNSPRRRRSRVLAVATAAALALAVVVGGVLTLRADPLPTAVEVERDDGAVTITVTDRSARADELEDAARAAGVDLEVGEVEVAPENVGRIIGSALSPGLGFLHEDPDDPGSPVVAVRIPGGLRGPLRIQYGVATAPNQDPNAGADATDKGELLECVDLRGMRLEDLLGEIQDRGLRNVRVDILSRTMSKEIFNADLPGYLDAVPLRVLVSGEEQTISITASDDGTRIPDLPTRQGCD